MTKKTDPRIKTARSAGCVGKNAITPRVARTFLAEGNRVLDFGCGKDGIHVAELCKEGYDALGYDLSVSLDEERNDLLIWKQVLDRVGTFHLVYGSNVINVQESESDLFVTCNDLRIAAGWGVAGKRKPSDNPCPILLNYPGEPRKLGWNMKKMKAWLRDVGLGVKPISIQSGVMIFPAPERIKGDK